MELKRENKGQQKGNGNVTNGSHIYDWDLAIQLCPMVEDQKEHDAVTRVLNNDVNVPIKGKAENRPLKEHRILNTDLDLDRELLQALKNGGGNVSDAAFRRAESKVAIIKGLALDEGVSEKTIKKLIEPFNAITNSKGESVTERYPVVYKDGKPFNMYKDVDATETGLTKDGKPHLGTKAGRERKEKSFAQDTGLTKDKQAHEGTKQGKTLGIPKGETKASITGLKKDGTPDLRTTRGKEIAAERATREAKKKEELQSKADQLAKERKEEIAAEQAKREAKKKEEDETKRKVQEQAQKQEREAQQRREQEARQRREQEAQQRREQEARQRREQEAQREREAQQRREQEMQRQRELERQQREARQREEMWRHQQEQLRQQEMIRRMVQVGGYERINGTYVAPYVRSAPSHNSWNDFQRAHGGQGYSRSQIREMYHSRK